MKAITSPLLLVSVSLSALFVRTTAQAAPPVAVDIVWVDADSSAAFSSITDGSTFTIDELPEVVNIVAVISNDPEAPVNNVQMQITGAIDNFNNEGSEPFSFFGDTSSGFNQISKFDFPVGNYTLTATPFTGKGSSREEGTTLEVTMTIITAVVPTPAPTSSEPEVVPTPAPKAGWELIYDEDDAANPAASVRVENGFVELDGLFYLMGGRGVEPTDVFDPTLADTPSEAWSSSDNITNYHHFTPIAFDGIIYVVDAFRGEYPKEGPARSVFAYEDGFLFSKVRIPPDRRRSACAVVLYQGVIYKVGGIQDGHLNSTTTQFDSYNPTTNAYELLPNEPMIPRDHAGAGVIDGKMYVAGGRVSDVGTDIGFDDTVAEIEVYDFATMTWSILPPEQNLPTLRASCAVVAYQGLLVVIGGESEFSTSALNDTEAFNPVLGTWETLAPLNKGRHGTTAFVFQDAIYIGGGGRERDQALPSSSIEKLEL